jgi:hypothetical protein
MKPLTEMSLRELYDIAGNDGHRADYRAKARIEIEYRRDDAIIRIANKSAEPVERVL